MRRVHYGPDKTFKSGSQWCNCAKGINISKRMNRMEVWFSSMRLNLKFRVCRNSKGVTGRTTTVVHESFRNDLSTFPLSAVESGCGSNRREGGRGEGKEGTKGRKLFTSNLRKQCVSKSESLRHPEVREVDTGTPWRQVGPSVCGPFRRVDTGQLILILVD